MNERNIITRRSDLKNQVIIEESQFEQSPTPPKEVGNKLFNSDAKMGVKDDLFLMRSNKTLGGKTLQKSVSQAPASKQIYTGIKEILESDVYVQKRFSYGSTSNITLRVKDEKDATIDK